MQKPFYFRNKGELLAGTLHLPAGRRRCPCVIICHGFTGQRCEPNFIFVRLSRRLEEDGIASLRFDFRGSGESEGEFEDMTPLEEVSDARAALARVRKLKRIDSTRLGIMGFSLGGLVAAIAAGAERTVRSTVLWAPVARPVQVFDSVHPKEAPRLLARSGRFDFGGLYVGRKFVEALKKLDPPGAIAKSSAPLLIVQGTRDDVVPFANSADFLKAGESRGIRTRRVAIKGADHVFSSVPWRDAVIESTAKWFKETLM